MVKVFALAIAFSALYTAATETWAYVLNITARNPRTLYLQVGVGGFTGTYLNAGTPGGNSTVNIVSVTVPANQLGTGVAQAMTTNSTVSASPLDGVTFCNVPSQIYVGGFYRDNLTGSGVASATLTVSSPANLTNGTGETIPFTEISWVSSGLGDSGAGPFPSATFVGGAQTLGTIRRNQWAETCQAFSFANVAVRAAGIYTGRVTYTLSLP